MMGFLKKLAHDCICLIYFNNIQELRELKAKLRLARKKLRKDVKNAKPGKGEIKEDVEKRLAEAMKYLKDSRTLEEKIQANQRSLISRFNWNQRCRLSSEIEDLKRDMLQYYVETIDSDRAVLEMRLESGLATDFKPSRSLKSALFEVVDSMKNESVIGVWGPRGVGKTSLAIQLEKKAKELLDFKVVRLVVSQSTTTEEVQDKLGALLDLSLQNKLVDERAELLRNKLIKTEQRILMILEDVCNCKELNLESIGISDPMSCKVVVTASDGRELKSCSITTSKEIKLGPLNAVEAWELLENNLNSDASSEIKEVAQKIAKEFEHSTVSIMILGRDLRGKVFNEWMEAYKRLKSKPKKGETKNIKIVYRCVKLSYNYLTDLKKQCFFLCLLFPEDYRIPVKDLKRYVWGLGIYKQGGIDSIEMVEKKVGGAIKTLTKSFLLLKQGKTHVRMTKVIRDAALLIASKDERFLRIKSLLVVGLWERRKNENLDPYTAISYVASSGYSYYRICDEFLQQFTALKVVAIHHAVLSLNALRNLINLKALHLEYCQLDGLSSLGELKQLEILSFQGSDISELPNQIGDLKYLILLDLTGCEKLQRIPLNLIRRLSRLEELYFSGRTFEEWWSEETSINSSPSRINSLPSLETDQGSGNESRALKVSALFQNESNESNLTVTHLDRDHILVVQNHVVPNLVQSVKKVKIQSCDNWRDVFQNGRFLHAGEDDSGALLSDFTSLELEKIPKLSSLVRVCSGQTLQNLTTLKVEFCCNLQSLFSITLAQSLNQLETLEIRHCNELEKIIDETIVDEARRSADVVDESVQSVPLHRQYLPSLKTLLITDCSALKYIFQVLEGQVFPKLDISDCILLKALFRFKQVAEQNMIESQKLFEIEVPLLKWLKLERLPYLTKFCIVEVGASCNLSKNDMSELSVKLPELEFLEVGACRNLRMDGMFKLIEHPKRLKVGARCNLSKNDKFKLIGHPKLEEFRLFEMKNQLCENIFDYEGGRLLSSLKILKLHDLHELQGIGEVFAQMVTLQKLEHLEVVKCNKLKNLFSLLLARNLLSLKKLVVQKCDELVQLIGQDQNSSSSSSSSFGYKLLNSVVTPAKEVKRMELLLLT